MFKNYFLIAVRHLLANPLFSAINILGLSIGITCCILIFMLVRYELGFDRYFSDAERIYRLGVSLDTGLRSANSVFPAAPQLALDHPEEIEAFTRMHSALVSLSLDDQQFTEMLVMVDADFFSIFDFRFVAGDPQTALTEPLSVVLTQSSARKYFGEADALGQSLSLEGNRELRVTGVIEDVPPNTHFDLTLVVPMSTVPLLLGEQQFNFLKNSWTADQTNSYIKLRDADRAEWLAGQLAGFKARHAQNEIFETRFYLHALSEIHLLPVADEPLPEREGRKAEVYGAASLAALILLTACINFINLTTAKAGLRTKEVAMRKALGAHPAQLVVQFLTETLVLVVMATLLALGAAELLLPLFGNLLNKGLGNALTLDRAFILALPVLILTTTLLAGAYPALVLSRLATDQGLRGERSVQGKSWLGQLLVVLQFCLATVMIVLMLVSGAQFRFMQQTDLGYDRDHVLMLTAMRSDTYNFRYIDAVQTNYPALKAELLSHPRISAVSGSTFAALNFGRATLHRQGEPVDAGVSIVMNRGVQYGYLEVMGIRLIAGRDFSPDMGDELNFDTRRASALLTRTGVEKLGFSNPQDSLEQIVEDAQGNSFRIVGVVEDVNLLGGYTDFKLDMIIKHPAVNALAVKIQGGIDAEVTSHIQKVWKSLVPNYALNYFSMDERNAAMENLFKRQIGAFQLFALLAIAIACFGLYAMTNFVTEQRNKEVGVRKVLGASEFAIVRLLLWDLSKPILLASVIAVPIAVIAAGYLLQNFPQQVKVHWGFYLSALSITLAIAWLTATLRTWRAATMNPIDALRYE